MPFLLLLLVNACQKASPKEPGRSPNAENLSAETIAARAETWRLMSEELRAAVLKNMKDPQARTPDAPVKCEGSNCAAFHEQIRRNSQNREVDTDVMPVIGAKGPSVFRGAGV